MKFQKLRKVVQLAGLRKKKEKKRGEERNSLLSALSFPQDVVSGESVLTFIGRQTVKIENYRSILIYTDENIRIQAKHYKVSVSGKRLCIRYYDKDEMEICGKIESVRFE